MPSSELANWNLRGVQVSLTDEDCLFCKIVAGDIPAEIVSETEHTLAFRDLNPQAPLHVLVIPRVHAADIASLAETAPEAAVDLLAETRRVARAEGHESYRLVFNTGADAGQTVFHVHGHVLAGRSLAWPPG
ncbi:histidine triad nucleotide-binding protein [Aeromicrobium chenweiae]|uniref:Histidine triad nucleotide-binding protein n=1 Tax=Aeromicrobium chenweiae TaxID=2079793 RepID=A0A2S0WKB0_9ACTN|nr:histidine triad nucleotide-binding protein [Aeromicrobium chenweiae]TGN32618.1 histidine triad nucleotide-binding protein [Aeromicrobium chenweiae]